MNEHDNQLTSTEAHSDVDRKSGRVVFDKDGRSVWEWQTATGVFTRNVTADQLSTLSTVELQLDETSREAEKAKVFTETRRRPPPAKSSRDATATKRPTRGVAAWMRGWLG